MNELKTFTTGKGTYDSFPDKTARAELPKKLTRPATAQVGDYLRIKAIGADGSMEVEAAPVPEGGSSGSSVAYPDWSHLKWHIIGDSLTDRNNDYAPKRYYDFIAQATGIQLSLDGIGGTGYGAGVSTNQHFVERVKNIPDDADIVTIFGSANDIKYAEGANSEIFHALSWITLNRPGLRVIVVPPAPVKWFTRSSDEWIAYGDRLKLCANKCLHRYVEDMYDCPPFDPNNEQHMAVFFTTDELGIHPNEAGHKAMAPIIYNALLQELELENGYPRGAADGTVSDEQIAQAVSDYMAENPVEVPEVDLSGFATEDYVDDAIANMDIPTGGGEKWETIIDYTAPEDCKDIKFTVDMNGEPFRLKNAIVLALVMPNAEGTGSGNLIAFTCDGDFEYAYAVNTYKHGLCTVPSAGKYSFFRIELIDTPIGVWSRQIIGSNNCDITQTLGDRQFTGGRPISVHEDFCINDMTSYNRKIDALLIGPNGEYIGAGTRVVMVGVRA